MDISLSYQAFSFFAMVICGFLCGVLFDLFRALRRHRKSACTVVAFQDILFWILEASLVYFVAFKLNYAHIRAYEGVALVIGSWLYFMTASSYVLGFLCALVSCAYKAAGVIYVPFKKTFKFIGCGFKWLKNLISSWTKNAFSRIKSAQKHIQKAKKFFTI